MPIVRALLLLCAVLACAWFAVGLRQTQDVEQARATINRPGPLGGARATRTAALLSDAGLLNPDLEAQILRGELALHLGRPAQARVILTDAVRREPMNLEAWVFLALSSQDDPRLLAAALGQVHRLSPAVPRS